MKIRLLAIGASALLLPFAAVACGGSDENNSGTRPTAAEISTSLSKELGTLPDGVADCIGKKVEASSLPNGVLRALVAGEDASIDKDNEAKYTKVLTDAGLDCTSAAASGS